MSEGYEPKPINQIITQSQFAIPSVILSPSSKIDVLSNVDPYSLTYHALDPIPQDRTLKAITYLWSNGSNLIPMSTAVINGKLSVTLYNPNSVSVDCNTIRFLMVWE